MKRLMTVFGCMLVAGFLSVAGSALAKDAKLGDLTIHQAWSRASANGAQTGAIYLSIQNGGSAADKLVGIDTPVADMAHLHTTEMQGDMASMKMMDAVELPAGETVTLKPQAMHVMLMGLKHPLKKGETFPMTLHFEKAGTVEVQVKVEAAGALAPSGS